MSSDERSAWESAATQSATGAPEASEPAILEIVPLPAFRDNYIWSIRRGTQLAVVDPGDAGPVIAHVRARGLQLAAVLITHHHADHTGGLSVLAERFDGAGGTDPLPVFGPAGESITGVNRPLAGGETILVPGLDLALQVLAVPGHTRGHLAYFGEGMLFCGDTLFGAGCGRLFEGTPAQMFASLSRLASLPGATRVYCAHEYTLQNLRFARGIEPDSPALAERESRALALRAAGQPTVPSTIDEERATNPFLRCTVPAVVRAMDGEAASDDPVAVFAALRRLRNTA